MEKKADILFEVSWEVCNKVGGIYTVIRSKAARILDKYRDNYFTIGPYFPHQIVGQFQEEPPEKEIKQAFEQLKNEGIICHYGRWLIEGNPKVILVDFASYKHKINEFMKNEGVIKWDNRDVYKIILDNKDYALVDYTVLAGEDLIKIARKKKVSEYNLMELNSLRNFYSLKAGQVIKVPITYSKRIIVYIDKYNFLPVYQELYDNKGLLATYEYHNLLINPVIADEEWTKNYKGYGY